MAGVDPRKAPIKIDMLLHTLAQFTIYYAVFGGSRCVHMCIYI